MARTFVRRAFADVTMNEVAKCRRDHNRLGFAYQIGFARLFNRFPAQQPLEINDELLSFVAVQMNIGSGADLRLRVVAAYGFGPSGSYPAISRPAAL